MVLRQVPRHPGVQLSFRAWNAIIFADVLNDHRRVDEIRRLMADKPEATLLMEQLVARKRALFGDDERMIGAWEVSHGRRMAPTPAPTPETRIPCRRIRYRRSWQRQDRATGIG